MSKKSKRQAMLKEQAARERGSAVQERGSAASRRSEARKPQVQTRNGAHAAPAHKNNGASVYSRALKASRSLNPTNLLYIRIVAVAVAVMAVAAGTTWGVKSQGEFTVGMVLGMVLLGLIAGSSLLVAFRTEDMVRRARAATRR